MNKNRLNCPYCLKNGLLTELDYIEDNELFYCFECNIFIDEKVILALLKKGE